MNRDRLRVSGIGSISHGVFIPNGLHLIETGPYLPQVMELMQRSWAVRSNGGPLDACLLAAGMVEIWFEPKLEVWDLAAPKLIMEKAGGEFFARDGSRRIDRGTALACAPGVSLAVCEAFGIVPALATGKSEKRRRMTCSGGCHGFVFDLRRLEVLDLKARESPQ